MNLSAGAGADAVRVRKNKLGAGVDNNHTKILCAVTAYSEVHLPFMLQL